MQSFNMPTGFRPKMPSKPSQVSPMAGSLPISMSKTRNQSAMSLVFGRKEPVSKSWSDLWDEEIEEEEQARQMHALKEMNSRTWSHESKRATSPVDDDNTPRLGLSPATKTTSIHADHDIPSIDMTLGANIDEDLMADGFFFHELPPAKEQPLFPNSPLSKRTNVDKWAVLGERRRAYTGSSSSQSPEAPIRTTRKVGSGVGSGPLGNGHGSPSFHGNLSFNAYLVSGHSPSPPHHTTSGKWIHHANRERTKECPRNKGRDRDRNWNFDWRKENRHAFGDVEWVGGWQQTVS